MKASGTFAEARPLLVPLGEAALLVRFGERLDETANRAAICLARALTASPPAGVVEIVPNLVSVLVRFDPERVAAQAVADWVRLALLEPAPAQLAGAEHRIAIRFDGPHLADVAGHLGVSVDTFIERHSAAPLRVLATGFAPGFVYCGFHGADLDLGRRDALTPAVPAGTVLFAARQTAITATSVPTGWHVIGRARFDNFDSRRDPPTRLDAGDSVVFKVAR